MRVAHYNPQQKGQKPFDAKIKFIDDGICVKELAPLMY